MQIGHGHDQCHRCQRHTDGLMTCSTTAGERSQLCPDCLDSSNFCRGCGNELTGEADTDMPEYCPDCKEEILNTWASDERNEAGLLNNYPQ